MAPKKGDKAKAEKTAKAVKANVGKKAPYWPAEMSGKLVAQALCELHVQIGLTWVAKQLWIMV